MLLDREQVRTPALGAGARYDDQMAAAELQGFVSSVGLDPHHWMKLQYSVRSPL